MTSEDRAALRSVCATALAEPRKGSAQPIITMLPVSLVSDLLDIADRFDELLDATADLAEITAGVLALLSMRQDPEAGGTTPAIDVSSLNPTAPAGVLNEPVGRGLFGGGAV